VQHARAREKMLMTILLATRATSVNYEKSTVFPNQRRHQNNGKGIPLCTLLQKEENRPSENAIYRDTSYQSSTLALHCSGMMMGQHLRLQHSYHSPSWKPCLNRSWLVGSAVLNGRSPNTLTRSSWWRTSLSSSSSAICATCSLCIFMRSTVFS
jgi:hypothetical protein